MLPTLEHEIYQNERIFQNAQDADYAYGLYSLIASYRLRKRSWNPFVRYKSVDYSRRLASAIVSIIRGEEFSIWYHREPSQIIDPIVEKDLKKMGWRVVE